MSGVEQRRAERRAQARKTIRLEVLDAARRVAGRDGARNLSLRNVAAEAGYAPAALYGYFRSRDELVLALAADDLAAMARTMRETAVAHRAEFRLHAVASLAVDLLAKGETLAAASACMNRSNDSDAERLFNGRLISVLTVLSAAAGISAERRNSQADVVLLAAALTGLALLRRAGRLQTLGFSVEEVLARLPKVFSAAAAA
ncbi:MAG: TetR family transcriptional regulator [Alphaproteobacteria bacterium]|jgi:AcrR family transcriptional regulator